MSLPLLLDTFSGLLGTPLTTHAADTGQAWIAGPSGYLAANGQEPALDGSGKLSTPSGGTGIFYNALSTPSPEFTYEFDLISTGQGGMWTVVFRYDPTSDSFYEATFGPLLGSGTGFGVIVGGVGSDLANGKVGGGVDVSPPGTYHCKIVCTDALKQFFIDGTLVWQVADNRVAAAGHIGVRGAYSGAPLANLQVDYIARITSASSVIVTKGLPMTPFHITTNFPGAPTSYSATNLPTGLSLNTATGVITGTATASNGQATVSAVYDGKTATAALDFGIRLLSLPPDAGTVAANTADPLWSHLILGRYVLSNGQTFDVKTGTIIGTGAYVNIGGIIGTKSGTLANAPWHYGSEGDITPLTLMNYSTSSPGVDGNTDNYAGGNAPGRTDGLGQFQIFRDISDSSRTLKYSWLFSNYQGTKPVNADGFHWVGMTYDGAGTLQGYVDGPDATFTGVTTYAVSQDANYNFIWTSGGGGNSTATTAIFFAFDIALTPEQEAAVRANPYRFLNAVDNSATEYAATANPTAFAGDVFHLELTPSPGGHLFPEDVVFTVTDDLGHSQSVAAAPVNGLGRSGGVGRIRMAPTPGARTLTFTNSSGLSDPAPMQVNSVPGVLLADKVIECPRNQNFPAADPLPRPAPSNGHGARGNWYWYYGGESIQFTAPGTRGTWWIAVDYYGNVVKSAAMPGSRILDCSDVGYGWFGVYVLDANQPNLALAAVGNSCASWNFVRVRASENLIEFPDVPGGVGAYAGLKDVGSTTSDCLPIRATAGSVGGVLRINVNGGTTIDNISWIIAGEKALILGRDSARPTRFSIQYTDGNLTSNRSGIDSNFSYASVTALMNGILALGVAPTEFFVEIFNEPEPNRMNSPEFLTMAQAFRAAVKAAHPDIPLAGLASVTITGSFLGAAQTFFTNHPDLFDAISFHGYNAGDSITDLRYKVEAYFAMLQATGQGSKPRFITEQGFGVLTPGMLCPSAGVRSWIKHILVYEQRNLPYNHMFYWNVENTDSYYPTMWVKGANPTALLPAAREIARQTKGRAHLSRLAFGGDWEDCFVGSIFGPANGERVAWIISDGLKDYPITFAVSGSIPANLTVTSIFGTETQAVVTNGQCTVPISGDSTFIRLPAGVSIVPMMPTLGSDKLLAAPVAASDGSDATKVTDGKLQVLVNPGRAPAPEEGTGDEALVYSGPNIVTQAGKLTITPAAPVLANCIRVVCPPQDIEAGSLRKFQARVKVASSQTWVNALSVQENGRVLLAYSNATSGGTSAADFSERVHQWVGTFAETTIDAVEINIDMASYGLGTLGVASQAAGNEVPVAVPTPNVSEVMLYRATAAPPASVYPPADQVRAGVQYGPTGADYTGSYSAPTPTYAAASDVRYNVDRGDGTLGSCRVPAAAQVLSGVLVGATSGTVVLPAANAVRSGVNFGAASGTTGSYSVTLPTAAQVLSSIAFGSPQASLTGNVVLPGAGDVRSGTAFGAAGGLIGTLSAGGGTPTPPAPPFSDGHIDTYDATGTLAGGVDLSVEMLSTTGTGISFGKRFTATSNDQGRATVRLLRGASYRIRRQGPTYTRNRINTDWVYFTVPDANSFALPNVVET